MGIVVSTNQPEPPPTKQPSATIATSSKRINKEKSVRRAPQQTLFDCCVADCLGRVGPTSAQSTSSRDIKQKMTIPTEPNGVAMGLLYQCVGIDI
jgi:hypothetical protein